MLAIDLSRETQKFLRRLPVKHAQQIARKIYALAEDPFPSDSAQLRGHNEYRRADMGEYRIVYRIFSETIFITLVGKRNDDDVYRRMRRLVR
ncbi:type II toxin-antitoxin system RelE/ParE family toxin [Candidatus Uhrbacteria bacterium]|nr:type II toxin-antitoxin system RelE/ParE family toxin [Candidatus Uhrbacteria bacterium]